MAHPLIDGDDRGTVFEPAGVGRTGGMRPSGPEPVASRVWPDAWASLFPQDRQADCPRCARAA